MNTRCECKVRNCPACGGRCQNRAQSLLVRVSELWSPLALCQGCSEEGLSSHEMIDPARKVELYRRLDWVLRTRECRPYQVEASEFRLISAGQNNFAQFEHRWKRLYIKLREGDKYEISPPFRPWWKRHGWVLFWACVLLILSRIHADNWLSLIRLFLIPMTCWKVYLRFDDWIGSRDRLREEIQKLTLACVNFKDAP